MAKSVMMIEFDRADRTYRGGETVRGVLRIRADRNLTWYSITLRKYWEIYGKGSTDKNLSHVKKLVRHGKLRTGEVLECPFSFTADCVPVTYQGQLINVDHYFWSTWTLPTFPMKKIPKPLRSIRCGLASDRHNLPVAATR